MITQQDVMHSRNNPLNSTVASARYALTFGLLIAGYFLIWIVLPLLLHSEIPGDNIEQIVWSDHPALGYSKHPPFPTWILCLFALVFPKTVPLTYVLGGLQVAAMLLLAWRLTDESLGRAKAVLAVLFITCINYYAFRMHFYNHNTVLLTATAASMYCTWRCSHSWQARWWIALGVCWAIGMLSKYQMAVPIACNALFLVLAHRTTPAKLTGRFAIAGTIFLAAISPHVIWLYQNDFPTFGYASHSLAASLSFVRRCSRMASFTADQIVRLLPLLVLLGWLRRGKARDQATHSSGASQVRTFFAIHAWGPLIVMLLLSLLAGVDLQTHWGTAFLWVIPLWVLTTPFGDHLATLGEKKLLIAWVAIQMLMIITYILE